MECLRAVGSDQDSKQHAIETLAREVASLLTPKVSEKSQRAIDRLEQQIAEADRMFAKNIISPDGVAAWSVRTAWALTQAVGHASDWAERFGEIEKEVGKLPPDRQSHQVLLMRRIALIRDLINEIKSKRVLVFDDR